MTTLPPEGPTPPSEPAPGAPPDPEYLKHALKAFKKRLKLTRLNEESGLGAHRPMTGGKKSGVTAIIPPREIPKAVWDELTRQGKIRNTGGGFYELREPGHA